MKSSLAVYMQQVGRYPLLDQESEERLTAEYFATRDPAIAKRLTESNLRLVMSAARSLGIRSEQVLADVIQEGNLGLMEAVQRFEPKSGHKFATFAFKWIRGSMLHCLTAKKRRSEREAALDSDVLRALGHHEAKTDVFMRKRLVGFGRSLIGRDRDIFRRRIYTASPMGLTELADRYRISRGRVHQIEQRVLHRLQKTMRFSRELITN